MCIRKSNVTTMIVYAFLIICVVVCMYPFFIMVMGSLKTSQELSANPAGFPMQPTFANYTTLATAVNGLFVRSVLNSLYVSSVYTCCMLFLAALAAFAFAKYIFPFKEIIFTFLMMTIMIPIDVLIPPMYIMFSRMGWLSTYTVQIVPGMANVMALFLLRQYMLGIPDSLLEASRMDGANVFQTFIRVIVPMCIPAMVSVGLLNYMQKWSDYIWPLLMVNKMKIMPVMVVLPVISTGEQSSSFSYELIMTGCVIATLPILVLFIALNKRIMLSVTVGAVKG